MIIIAQGAFSYAPAGVIERPQRKVGDYGNPIHLRR